MKNTEIKNDTLFFSAFILLTVFKFSFAGFSYIPYLDDYVQYLYYPDFGSPFSEILFGGAGTAFTRPLAALLDIYFWSKFFVFPGAAVILLSVLYSLSAIFFYLSAKELKFTVSPLFLFIYALLPSAVEGTYWISAATRLVPALFFTSVSLYFMIKNRTLLFFIFALLSHGFYEQVSILFFCAACLIFLTSPKKYLKEFMLALLSVSAIAAYYLIFGKMGDNSDRIGIDPKFYTNLKTYFYALADLLFKKQLPLYTKGFIRGFRLIANTHSYMWISALFLISVFLFIFFPKEKSLSFSLKKLFSGFVLFAAPVLPFLIIKDSWLNFRNIVPSILGFAIIIDTAFSYLLKDKIKYLAFFLMLYLCICNVSEVWDYHKTAFADRKIITEIADSYNDENILYYEAVSEKYLPQNSPYHDHIMSIVGSDWGLTGTVRAVLKNRNIIVNP